MLKRITLENFMSHKHTVIELADGLTVLTGPNNCGKSAVVAALQILASNGRTTHVLRHGAKRCRITVETEEGHTIVWDRGQRSGVKYTLNGEDIHRVGQNVPDSLQSLLRLAPVEAEVGKSRHEYDIHFGEQKSPVFLLGESGSRAASFFASSSDASRLVEMQHRHRSRVQEHRQEATRLTAELKVIEGKLEKFSPVDELDETVQRAEREYQAITRQVDLTGSLRVLLGRLEQFGREVDRRTAETKLLRALETAATGPDELTAQAATATRLGEHRVRLVTVSQDAARLRRESAAVSTLATPPSLADTAAGRRLTASLDAGLRSANRARRTTHACQQLLHPPALEPTVEIARQARQLERLSGQRRTMQQHLLPLAKIAAPPQLGDTASLERTIKKTTNAIASRDHFGALCTRLAQLVPPGPDVDGAQLRQRIEALTTAHSSARAIENEVRRTVTAVEECRDAIVAHIQDHPQCEVCGSRLEVDTVLSTAPTAHTHQRSELR